MDDVVSTLVLKVDTSEAREQMDQLEKKTESLLSTVEKARETLTGFDLHFPWKNEQVETDQSPVIKYSNEGKPGFSEQSRKTPFGEHRENTFPSGIFRQWESSIEKILQSTNQGTKQTERDTIRMYDPLEPSKRALVSDKTQDVLSPATYHEEKDRMNSSMPVFTRENKDNGIRTDNDLPLSPSEIPAERQSESAATRLVDRLEKSVANLLTSISFLSEGIERKETSNPLLKQDNDHSYFPSGENIEHSTTDTSRSGDSSLPFPESNEKTKEQGTNDLLKNLALLLRSGDQERSGQKEEVSNERWPAIRDDSAGILSQEQGLSHRIESAILEMDRRTGEIVQLLGNTDSYLRRLASTAPNNTIVVKVE